MATATLTAIEKIEQRAKKVAGGEYKVRPGQPYRFSEAAQPGDIVWQGDLGLMLLDKVPAGYTKAKKPFVQLVPGNTEGSRHCLDALAGVEIWLPKGWPESAETDFLGPVLVLAEERTVLHPKHGPVTLLAGGIVECSYQREYDTILRRERRNAD